MSIEQYRSGTLKKAYNKYVTTGLCIPEKYMYKVPEELWNVIFAYIEKVEVIMIYDNERIKEEGSRFLWHVRIYYDIEGTHEVERFGKYNMGVKFYAIIDKLTRQYGVPKKNFLTIEDYYAYQKWGEAHIFCLDEQWELARKTLRDDLIKGQGSMFKRCYTLGDDGELLYRQFHNHEGIDLLIIEYDGYVMTSCEWLREGLFFSRYKNVVQIDCSDGTITHVHISL